ncbi:helix-turn-helix domain-containing protein [Geodermatophilus sp. YIM 151500]|uniref:helix-turn-helix domain-containing protein n=1 Tax=Geodermatophilus sp. YIM 151500 TaxID=2984531 RepID=UPI0021E4400E|nr:helix-turn-helix domain-containing protein [Geodermatophilus sp. YIM 151500]MCV2488237.1 helix-turn-helix domain-containing protein [Geodermatophilus sp. YIM 151500]
MTARPADSLRDVRRRLSIARRVWCRPAVSTIRYDPPVPVIASAGSLLREARSRAGMTQAELAARADTTQSVVSAYESGHRQPSLPVLLRLIAATGHALEGGLVATKRGQPVPLAGTLGRRVRRHRREIVGIAERYGARNVRIFGSVARGVERPDSDIDVLVDLPLGTGLFTLGVCVGIWKTSCPPESTWCPRGG